MKRRSSSATRLRTAPFASQVSLLLSAAVMSALATSAQAQRQFESLGTRGLPANANNTTELVVGDVDGDGDLDVVVGNFTYPGEQSRLYLNNGRNNFTDVTATHMPVGIHRTGALAMGDVDGDGDLDLVVGNRNEPSLLYVNDGTGVFTDATAGRLSIHALNTSMTLGDVDGDGDLDLVVGNYYFQPSQLLLNDGTGTFTDATAGRLSLGPRLRTGVLVLGDVDGDGDLDLFCGHGGNPGTQDRLFLNSGTGVFTEVTATNLPIDTAGTSDVAFGDIDGDGDLDLLLTAPPRLYLNNGAGSFTDVSAAQLPPGSAWAIALGDVDGDGDLDLVLGQQLQQSVFLFQNDGTGRFTDVTAVTMPVAPNIHVVDLSLSDMDGDGDLDLVIGNNHLEPSLLYSNDGSGRFTDVSNARIPTIPAHTTAAAVGDVDGDNDTDVVLGNYGEQSRLYLNDGSGKLIDATAAGMPTLNAFTTALAAGDVDGDGDTDLIVGNGGRYSGQQSRLYLNGGGGSFIDATAAGMPVANHQTTALTTGDVDGDGDLDLIVGNYYGQSRLYLNNGGGVFADASASRMPSLNQSTTALALGDVDGDGDLDLVIGNGGYFGGQSRLYLNGGNGSFTDATAARLPALARNTAALALGDVDGDGDLDLVVGNEGQQDLLYLNDGTGTFADATTARMPVDSGQTTSLRLGDVDEDGDLDLVVGDRGQNSLYVNDGTGTFTDVTAVRMAVDGDITQAIALVDLDMDGDLDLLVGNDGQSRVDLNLRRQLDAPDELHIGSSYQIDAYSRYGPASPGETVFPLLSTGSAHIPFSPLGTIGIDLNRAVALPPFAIALAAGTGSMTLPVPNQPGLVGIPIFLQSLLVPQNGQPRLTNVVWDVVR